jgi:23S rRNA (guanosine2251-2'-O)-methyltransferase
MTIDENLIFGINPVLEKLKASSGDILEILIAESAGRLPLREISQQATRLGLALVHVHPKTLDRLVDGQRHQGVVARVEAYAYLPFADLLKEVSTNSAANRILVLDGLTDPRNFGALLRTAEAVQVSHVIIPKDRSVGVTPVVVKASAGAVHHVKITKVTNLRRALSELKAHDFWTVGLDGNSRETIYDKTFPQRLAIVLGSEGTGVRPVNLRECDFAVSIPMLGKISSLNVAVAGAVFLYELLRQDRCVDKDLAKRL